MLQTYEAIYSGNQIRWINQAPPELDEERRVVVVMNVEKSAAKPKQNIHEVLEQAWGCLGRGKSLDEIDQEINEMR
ncbi:hypothetical protein QUF54_03895 [Candidatus Marithioploca araucensis]|uniref:Uncharacterized protein n=1 Tax=Candidatus Marithioploca araucensis TaxID=70273 RepID=A0ABT7VS21_9GAMM|nr:hypothetical protein [Candidatus Marithioploca araucensis]